MAQRTARDLLQKLSKGEDCEEATFEFVGMAMTEGFAIPDALVLASLGNRAAQTQPCPNALRVLLVAKASPNVVDSQVGVSALHNACWHGSVQVTKLLLDFKADMGYLEPRMKTPPLNTALAAGNAKVCLELLNRNADVQWKHQDGATALHVATAWIASAHNSELRMPPVGEEPRAVVAMMLHNGVDPTLTEGMTRSERRGTGMTPLEAFRQDIAKSPWRTDPTLGEKFDKTAKAVHTLLEQGEEAVRLKKQGNTAFNEKRFDDAIKYYAQARQVWEGANIRGHHSAVLWSNEATCQRKAERWEECRNACEQGLKHYCSAAIKDKLTKCLNEAKDVLADIAKGEVKEKPPKPKVPAKPHTKLDDGFLTKHAQATLYPEEGSAQGKTHNPGPFICGFSDAKEAGFVDGVDGWKDRNTRAEQELDQQLVKEGLMDPELLDDPKSVSYINTLPPEN